MMMARVVKAGVGHQHGEHGEEDKESKKKRKKKKKPAPSDAPKPAKKLEIVKAEGIDAGHFYAMLYDPPSIWTTVYAVGLLAVAIACVMFPMWPKTLRVGVWYLSMASIGFLGAFFGLVVIRLILYIILLMGSGRKGWLFPNLLADVGVIDSFKPLWKWEKVKRRKSKSITVPQEK